jgi:head-tail adaptor
MPFRTPLLDVDVRRHYVSLSRAGTPVPDGDGGYTSGDEPLDPPTWWCAIGTATAADMERMVAGGQQATATHVLRGQFHPGITVATRIAFRGRTFEVQSVENEDERDIALRLVCTEVVTHGGA